MAKHRAAAEPPRFSLAIQLASTRPCPDRSRVRRWVAAAVRHAEVTTTPTFVVRFVDSREARGLNLAFRLRDYATNVLTFPYEASHQEGAPEGADIVICMPVVQKEAREQHKAFIDHCAHMVVHGVLHALGHDHEQEDETEAMETLETRILHGFRIADPYA